MRNMFLECPTCGTPLQVPPSQAGGVCRCGACTRKFRVPTEFYLGAGLLPVAEWRWVRTGLGITYYAGIALLLVVLVGAGSAVRLQPRDTAGGLGRTVGE